jgi:hypothetical protein
VNYLQVHFRHRHQPFRIPVCEDTTGRVLNLVTTSSSLAALSNFETEYGQPILINTDHVQFVQCLLEPGIPHFPPGALKASPFGALEDSESVLASDGIFDVTIWFSSREEPLDVGGVSYDDWDSICLGLSQPDPYFQFTDGDGEKVIIHTAEVIMILATEFDRYSPEQLDKINELTKGWA